MRGGVGPTAGGFSTQRKPWPHARGESRGGEGAVAASPLKKNAKKRVGATDSPGPPCLAHAAGDPARGRAARGGVADKARRRPGGVRGVLVGPAHAAGRGGALGAARRRVAHRAGPEHVPGALAHPGVGHDGELGRARRPGRGRAGRPRRQVELEPILVGQPGGVLVGQPGGGPRGARAGSVLPVVVG